MSYDAQRNVQQDSWVRYIPYTLAIIALSVPLLVLISIDLSSYDANRRHDTMDLTNHTTPDAASYGRFFTWIVFLCTAFASFTVYREMAEVDHYRNDAEALSRLLYDGSILYFIAGVRDKIWYAHERIPPGVFLSLIFGFAVVYTFAFAKITPNTKTDHIVVTMKRIMRSPSILFLIFIPALIVICVVVVYHLMTAWRVSASFFGVYIGIVATFVVYHAGLAMVYGERFHFHHWYIALFCTHACLFNTDTSIVCQAAFLAIYLHGICVFGPDPVVEDLLLIKAEHEIDA